MVETRTNHVSVMTGQSVIPQTMNAARMKKVWNEMWTLEKSKCLAEHLQNSNNMKRNPPTNLESTKCR